MEETEESSETLILRLQPCKGPVRKTFCNADKLQIIAYAEKHGNLAAVNKFRVHHDTLRSWIKRRTQIMISDPFKYTNRGSKKKVRIQPENRLTRNLIEKEVPLNKSQGSRNTESEPIGKNSESFCFICCASVCCENQVAQSDIDGHVDKECIESQIQDTLSVLKLLIDMFSIQVEKPIVITTSRNISFCPSCTNLITKWGALLKELMDLQNLMERQFSQMENLKKGVEEMFEEFNRGSVSEKLQTQVTPLVNEPGTSLRLDVIESGGNDAQDSLASGSTVIKIEHPDAEIGQSMLSNSFAKSSNDSSPKGLRTRGKLRKLPVMRYNEEHSENSEVYSDGPIGNDDSPANSDSEISADADTNSVLKKVAGKIKHRVRKPGHQSNVQMKLQTPIKSRSRKRRSFVVVGTDSEDSDCSRGGVSFITDCDIISGLKVSKKRHKIHAENTASRRKKLKRPPKQNQPDLPPEESESELPSEVLTLIRKRDLRLVEFPDGRLFIRFIEVFRADDKFKCSHCGEKLFESLSDLRGHIVDDHGDILEQNKGKRCCGPRKKRRDVMTPKSGVMPPVEFIRVGDKIQCSICKDKLYNSRSSLRTHMRFTHYGVETFECTLCGMKLAGRGRLNTHMKSHVPAKTAICEICGRSFKTDVSLANHKRSLHAENGGKKFPCDFCGKEFTFKRDCVIHTMSHTGEKPIQCELCAETFKVRALLSRHLRNVHGQDPRYTCPKCGEMFSNLGLLHTHVGLRHPVELQPNQTLSSSMDNSTESFSTLQTPKDSETHSPDNTSFLATIGFEPLLPLQ